jgi:glycosyltransferase involved in cell wall biosynthesis
MRVGYDEQVFLAQSRGGISRYFVSLIEEFAADPGLGVAPVTGWRLSSNAHATEAGLSRTLPALGRVPAAARAAYYVANTSARRRAQAADLLHHSYFHPRFLAADSRAGHVTTVHDMIPELFPETFSGANPHLAKRAYVEASDLIICVSQSAYDDLVTVYGKPAAPVRVIHHGVDLGFAPGLPEPEQRPARYLLYVGKREGYKDFGVLLQAFAALDDAGVVLVAVGGGPFSPAELSAQARLGVAGRVQQRGATDVQLRRLYAHAEVFVFPSRHEGFGLPTLEAMASAAPVVLADTSSHPEAGGEVARYFPPGDDEALRQALEQLLGDQALRRELGQAGVARAAGFSWQASARAHAEAYRSLFAWRHNAH